MNLWRSSLLPFLKLKTKPVAGIIMSKRTPDEPETKDEAPEDHSAAIEACASALISAVHAHDVKAVSEALADAFTILDSMPHEEGEHISPHSYDAQNQKAAKE